MTASADITPELLRQLIRFDSASGKYFWRRSGRETLKNIDICNGYCRVFVANKKYYAHRVVWAFHHGKWPENEIDHINGDKLDNRLCNLRDVPHGQNSKNLSRFSNNKSGHSGVSWDGVNNKWRAQIFYNGKSQSLGRFIDKEDAIAARKAAEQKFGYHANHGKVTK